MHCVTTGTLTPILPATKHFWQYKLSMLVMRAIHNHTCVGDPELIHNVQVDSGMDMESHKKSKLLRFSRVLINWKDEKSIWAHNRTEVSRSSRTTWEIDWYPRPKHCRGSAHISQGIIIGSSSSAQQGQERAGKGLRCRSER
jgi:hypothetical protein